MLKRFLCLVLCVWSAWAMASAPTEMLEGVSRDLLHQLNASKNVIETNQDVVVDIINRVLLPKIDTAYMSKSVIGPVYWRGASPTLQQAFTSEFVHMVTMNYARLFSAYSNQNIEFIPYKGDYSHSKRIEVKSMVTAGEKERFTVSYKLVKQANDDWLIYDFSIDGVSMIESYKSQFYPVLSQKGMAGLIKSMKAHNKKNAS